MGENTTWPADLRRCFGLRTAIATAFADNPIGWLVEDFILQGGVDTSLIRWVPYDGIGRTRWSTASTLLSAVYGYGAPVCCSDRGNTAISQAKRGDFDWEAILGRAMGPAGCIQEASSPRSRRPTPEVAVEAIDTARRYGTITSFDLNYRDSLLQDPSEARRRHKR